MSDQVTAADFIGQFYTQLKARLAAAEDFNQVVVHLIKPSDDLPDSDTIILISGEITELQEYVHPNRSRDAEVAWPAYLRAYSYKPGDSAGDGAAFQAAMERAADIVGEIAAEIAENWPEVGQQTRTARVGEVGYTPMVMDDGGWGCHCRFMIAYGARVRGM